MSGQHAPSSVDEVRYLILAAQREGSRQFAAWLREHDLTPAQAEVLEVLHDHQPLTLAELGRLMVCEAGSPSRLVDALVRRGLVAREPGSRDRRAVALTLTPTGRSMLDSTSGADVVRQIITDRLGSADLDQLAALLRRLLAGTPAEAAITARFPVRDGTGR